MLSGQFVNVSVAPWINRKRVKIRAVPSLGFVGSLDQIVKTFWIESIVYFVIVEGGFDSAMYVSYYRREARRSVLGSSARDEQAQRYDSQNCQTNPKCD